MLDVVFCSLFVSSLGVQAVLVAIWMNWQQSVEGNLNEEEETLTQYETKADAPGQQANSHKQQHRDPRLVGWEFKIIRANRNLFRNPAVLQQLCEEETEVGWILLEKLDDRRLRFKRPMSLRYTESEFSANDPYRSYYGSAWQPLTWFSAIAALVATVLPAYLGYSLVSRSLSSSQPAPSPPPLPSIEQSLP